jgi:hypothetical protein
LNSRIDSTDVLTPTPPLRSARLTTPSSVKLAESVRVPAAEKLLP